MRGRKSDRFVLKRKGKIALQELLRVGHTPVLATPYIRPLLGPILSYPTRHLSSLRTTLVKKKRLSHIIAGLRLGFEAGAVDVRAGYDTQQHLSNPSVEQLCLLPDTTYFEAAVMARKAILISAKHPGVLVTGQAVHIHMPIIEWNTKRPSNADMTNRCSPSQVGLHLAEKKSADSDWEIGVMFIPEESSR